MRKHRETKSAARQLGTGLLPYPSRFVWTVNKNMLTFILVKQGDLFVVNLLEMNAGSHRGLSHFLYSRE